MSKLEYNSIIEGMGDAVGVSPKTSAKRTVKFYPTVGESRYWSLEKGGVMWGGLAPKRLSLRARGMETFRGLASARIYTYRRLL